MIELVRDEPPTAILSANQGRRRNPNIVVIGRMDIVVREEIHGIGRNTRRLHVDRKQRQPFVLGHIRVRANRKPDVIGIASQAGKDLLAVDHVVIAVSVGTGRQRRQVGPGTRLGVADTEMNLASKDLRKEELLLLRSAVLHDRGGDAVDRQHGHRCARLHRFIEENELLDQRAALAAVLLGPADPQPAVPAHLANHLAHGLPHPVVPSQIRDDFRGEKLRVVGAQLLAQALLLVAVTDIHDLSLAPSRDAPEPVLERVSFCRVVDEPSRAIPRSGPPGSRYVEKPP